MIAENREEPLQFFDNPDTPVPDVQLLSNGRYHVMVTSAGGGYSRWKGLAVTRWREDATCDNWGAFRYIRDVASGHLWSTTYQPALERADTYETAFAAGRAAFRRCDDDIETHTEIAVSPEKTRATSSAHYQRLSHTHVARCNELRGNRACTARPRSPPIREADRLHISPCVPADWNSFQIHYRYRETVYHITVQQSPIADGGPRLMVEGVELPGPAIPMVDDRRPHSVGVRIRAAQS